MAELVGSYIPILLLLLLMYTVSPKK